MQPRCVPQASLLTWVRAAAEIVIEVVSSRMPLDTWDGVRIAGALFAKRGHSQDRQVLTVTRNVRCAHLAQTQRPLPGTGPAGALTILAGEIVSANVNPAKMSAELSAKMMCDLSRKVFFGRLIPRSSRRNMKCLHAVCCSQVPMTDPSTFSMERFLRLTRAQLQNIVLVEWLQIARRGPQVPFVPCVTSIPDTSN